MGSIDQLLVWFFGPGVTSFERSTSGPMWERAWLYDVPKDPKAPEPTVKPMQKERQHDCDRYEPDRRTLTKHGLVSRRLARVTRQDPLAFSVLQLYYGDEGCKWSHHDRGRLAALFPLTASGRELIARARRTSNRSLLELSDQDRLIVEITLDSSTKGKDEWRRRRITLAAREAQALYERAVRVWDGCGEGE